ncbi:phage tail tape measure protein [Snodgrassella sp. CFCC 13594]|uniref:phage tail tape measure protein n=1 Tax=Snodgrassella sp. CFCC 13594 TaxID=1775559 RepID=UPI0008321067|nr:phage tail tape measure protein [Snodgrassella sp. CFCC 13594]
MAKELLVSVAIGATLKAGFTAVFGRAENSAKTLGTEIKTVTKQHEALGRSMRAQQSLNPSRDLSKQARAYAGMAIEISKATKAQEGLNKAIAGQKAAAANRQRLRSEMVETAGHAAVIAAPIVGAVKKYMEQESASADLKVSMMKKDGSFGQFNAIDKLNAQLGQMLPGNKADFTRMSLGLKSQGVSDKTILNGGGLATAQLNVVMGNDIADGSFFAKLMEAHGIKEHELLKAADLTQRAKFAAGLDKEDMYQAMAYYAPKANTLGLTGLKNQKQIFAVEGLAANKGLEGSSFGTNFSMMLSQLSKGPQMIAMASKGMKAEVRNMMESSGAQFEFFNKDGTMKSLRDITGEMETGFNKIKAKFGDRGVMDVADAIFGQEGGRVAQIMGQAGLSGFDAFVGKMDQQASLQDRIKVKTDTLSSSLEQLGGVAENAAGQLGSIFAPDIRAFADSAQGLIDNWIVPFMTQHKGLIKSVVGLMAGLFTLKLAILGVSYAGSMMAMPFRSMLVGVNKFKALKSIWALMRIGEVSRGVAVFRMLGLSAGNAAKAAGLVGHAASPLTGVFTRIAAGAGAMGKAQIALALLRQGLMAVGRAFLMTPIGLVVAAIAVAALLIYKYWKQIKAFFGGLWDGIKQGMAPLAPMFAAFGTALSSVWQHVQPFVQPIINWFRDFFSVSQVAEGGARSFGQAIGMWIGQTISAVVGWVVGKINEMKAAFSGGLTGILTLIINWSPLGAFYSAFAGVMGWLGITLPSSFTGFGRMIINGLVNGIKSGASSVVNTIVSLGKSAITAGKAVLGIHSPSRVFRSIGGYVTEGLQIGLSGGASKPLAAIGNIASGLQQRFKNRSGTLSAQLNEQMQANSAEFARGRVGQPSNSQGVTINYNPTIQLTGNADVSAIQQALKLSQREFEEMYRRMVHGQELRSY